jgi:hypothetical protein
MEMKYWFDVFGKAVLVHLSDLLSRAPVFVFKNVDFFGA